MCQAPGTQTNETALPSRAQGLIAETYTLQIFKVTALGCSCALGRQGTKKRKRSMHLRVEIPRHYITQDPSP